MNIRRTIALLAGCGLLVTVPVASEPRPDDPPPVHIAWHAPWGSPQATQNLVAECGDTTLVDTLFLTFECPKKYIQRVRGISGALLFEPQAGDTLGAFWFNERGGTNAGNLLVDFDLINTDDAQTPWRAYVAGRVGYAHEAGRGRLDLSADVPVAKVLNLFPGMTYYFARVTIHRKRCDLAGCLAPMRITWAGGRFRWNRPGSKDASFGIGPGQSVTWNAPRSSLACRRTRLAIETWVPPFAPPSRAVLAQGPIQTPVKPSFEPGE